MKVMVSYNLGDTQVGSKETHPNNPHGEWLAEHFSKTASACKVNVGGSADAKKNQHGAQQGKAVSGEFVAMLAGMS
jgi:hypothetical protein